MNILQLPIELLQRILFFSALSRGVKRALRLKLVCRAFDRSLDAALFKTRLLDSFIVPRRPQRPRPMEDWRIKKDHGAQRFRHAYLVYRARQETTGKYGEINEVACALSRYTGDDFEETLRTLCWLALEQEDYKYVPRDRAGNPSLLGQNLLSAAAHLGHMSLARELLQDGHSPTASERPFGSPIFLAAFAGNVDMFKLLQEYLPEFDDEEDFYYHPRWEGLRGALQRGDLDMFQLAAFPPSGAAEEQPHDNTEYLSDLAKYLESSRALTSTRSWELYSHVCSFLQDHPSETGYSMEHRNVIVMSKHAQYGNLEMIQGLLDAGVSCYHLGHGHKIPLIKAAGYAHKDVVDLLLEHGADPNHNNLSQEGSALITACGSGSLATVRKLLDHGASFRYGGFHRSLRHAIRLEHTAIVELLLEKGSVTEYSLMRLKDMAMEEGLDSMVDILETVVPDQSE
ncbi:ankyrin [Hypoxylon sp. NC0597]|nr:ankyrin [Hypoxylon sp. NC0597]